MGTHATKVAKNLNNKHGQKLVDIAKKSATDPLEIADKRAIHKTSEACGDLVANFVADNITIIFKNPANEPHSNAASNEIPKERYISTRKTKNY